MERYVAATLRSLAFLTRMPPVPWAFTGHHPLGDDTHAFPVAGVIAALPAALVLLMAAAPLSAPGMEMSGQSPESIPSWKN